MHPPAVRYADENDNIRNSVWENVQDFAAAARLVGRDRDHSVEHAETEPHITKQRRDNQQPTRFSRFPKANRSDDRRYDGQIRNRVGMNSASNTKRAGSILRSAKHACNWSSRSWNVIRQVYRCWLLLYSSIACGIQFSSC